MPYGRNHFSANSMSTSCKMLTLFSLYIHIRALLRALAYRYFVFKIYYNYCTNVVQEIILA